MKTENLRKEFEEFKQYLSEARNKFVKAVSSVEPFNTELRVEAEDILIAYDQCRDRLEKLTEKEPVNEKCDNRSCNKNGIHLHNNRLFCEEHISIFNPKEPVKSAEEVLSEITGIPIYRLKQDDKGEVITKKGCLEAMEEYRNQSHPETITNK